VATSAQSTTTKTQPTASTQAVTAKTQSATAETQAAAASTQGTPTAKTQSATAGTQAAAASTQGTPAAKTQTAATTAAERTQTAAKTQTAVASTQAAAAKTQAAATATTERAQVTSAAVERTQTAPTAAAERTQAAPTAATERAQVTSAATERSQVTSAAAERTQAAPTAAAERTQAAAAATAAAERTQATPTAAAERTQTAATATTERAQVTAAETQVVATRAKGVAKSDIPLDILEFETPRARSRANKPKRRWQAALLYSLIGVVLLGALTGFMLYRFNPFERAELPTEAVTRGTFVSTIDVNGMLQPREQEVVTTALTGSISEIWVAEGDMVDEGQALFEVEIPRGHEDVTAPIAGQVAQLDLATGKSYAEQIGTGSSGIVIADLTYMEVALDVNEVDVPQIAVGQTAVLHFDAIPDLTLNATVSYVSTLPNEGAAAAGLAPGGTVVTYPVKLKLDEDDSRLKPGMSVSARITVSEVPDVLLVNALAVQDLDGTPVVYVQESKDNVVAVEINIIASSPTQTAVEGELGEGEQVVVDMDMDEAEEGSYGELFTVRSRFSG
jgi:multidrug efflux pump subunit AcrA (membrane-fusion protein)